MHLLNIQSSPRGPRSASIALGDAFLAELSRRNPALTIDTLNVWDEHLPEFDAEAIGAKYKGVAGEPMDQAEDAVWQTIQTITRRFQQADRIVLGVPMWNFAYPYKLKQLIDLASQRNFLFTYDGTRFGPCLQTPRALVIYTRGQRYKEDSAIPASVFDHQSAYLEFWLRFIGVHEVRTLTVENTWSPDKEEAAAAVEQGKLEAVRLAADF